MEPDQRLAPRDALAEPPSHPLDAGLAPDQEPGPHRVPIEEHRADLAPGPGPERSLEHRAEERIASLAERRLIDHQHQGPAPPLEPQRPEPGEGELAAEVLEHLLHRGPADSFGRREPMSY